MPVELWTTEFDYFVLGFGMGAACATLAWMFREELRWLYRRIRRKHRHPRDFI